MTAIGSSKQSFDIPEDKIYKKIVACIPLFSIVACLNFRSLDAKTGFLERIANPTVNQKQHHIRALKVLNDYLKANLIDQVLKIAISVSLIAAGFINWYNAILIGGLGVYGIFRLVCELPPTFEKIDENHQNILKILNQETTDETLKYLNSVVYF